MNVKNRKGFTLVELIVVIGILGIVSMAILSILQFTNRSWINANQRSNLQAEVRMALELVKEEIGIAEIVIIYDEIPTSIPADAGYCFYDPVTQVIQLRTLDGKTYSLLTNIPEALNAQILFEPVIIGTNVNTVLLDWTVNDYSLSTNVFIQNMPVDYRVTTIYTLGSEFHPGIFIEFN